jgi:hypothetical protein
LPELSNADTDETLAQHSASTFVSERHACQNGHDRLWNNCSGSSVASFEREKALVEHLLRRLNLPAVSFSNPNADGKETGIDVVAHFVNGSTLGVQVTEIDPHPMPGKARAEEKLVAGKDPNRVYAAWAQNDRCVILDALARSIQKKASIADQHSCSEVPELWLLVCAGIPEHGAAVSTFVMTPWLSADDLNFVSDSLLEKSKFARSFFLPILGAERAIYGWRKNHGWKKSVQLDDIRDIPRASYVENLRKAALAGDWQEVDRLCDDECRTVLAEIRGR